MYTIVMGQDKSLITTVKETIYRREKLVDKIQFLIPQKYNDINLSDFTAILKYLDQTDTAHSEILVKDDELYKNHLRFTLPIDTNITKYDGDIHIRITLSKIDAEAQKQYVLHTGETTISVLPLSDYYAFVNDESLEFVDQIVGKLESKIDAVEKIAETYDKEKADNLSYEDNKLQLTSNGEKIGNAVVITSGGGTTPSDEFEVVEF